jgi:hypothetical protein
VLHGREPGDMYAIVWNLDQGTNQILNKKRVSASVITLNNVSTWNTAGIATDELGESSIDPPRILRVGWPRRVSPPFRDCKCTSRGKFDGFTTRRASHVDELNEDAKTHPEIRIKGLRSLCLFIIRNNPKNKVNFLWQVGTSIQPVRIRAKSKTHPAQVHSVPYFTKLPVIAEGLFLRPAGAICCAR